MLDPDPRLEPDLMHILVAPCSAMEVMARLWPVDPVRVLAAPS